MWERSGHYLSAEVEGRRNTAARKRRQTAAVANGRDLASITDLTLRLMEILHCCLSRGTDNIMLMWQKNAESSCVCVCVSGLRKLTTQNRKGVNDGAERIRVLVRVVHLSIEM